MAKTYYPRSTGAPSSPQSHTFTNETEKVVVHNLGHYPSVWILDENGEVIDSDIQHDSVNQITVSFQISLSGTIFVR